MAREVSGMARHPWALGRHYRTPSPCGPDHQPLPPAIARHGIVVPVDIGQLVGVFYARLWNRWDDEAVDSVLAPGFAFRGSLGVEVVGRRSSPLSRGC